MKHTKQNEFQTIGFSSILVVFVMLALSTFTVLTLVSANADYKLTKIMADGNTAYYEASNRARSRLAELDRTLEETYHQDGRLTATRIQQILPSDMSLERSSEGTMVSFTEPIADGQILKVQLLIAEYPTDQFYRIQCWQKVSSASPSESGVEENLHVL